MLSLAVGVIILLVVVAVLIVSAGAVLLILLKLGVITQYALKKEPEDQSSYHLEQSAEPAEEQE
jgi:hypothetical protein